MLDALSIGLSLLVAYLMFARLAYDSPLHKLTRSSKQQRFRYALRPWRHVKLLIDLNRRLK